MMGKRIEKIIGVSLYIYKKYYEWKDIIESAQKTSWEAGDEEQIQIEK